MKNSHYLKKILNLILPFGRKRFIWVVFLSISQGILQALSIFSILPFLSFVTNPDMIAQSGLYLKFEYLLPPAIKDNLVLTSGCIAITLILLSSLTNVFADYYRSKYANDTGMLIGSKLLAIYAYQPYIFHVQNNSGELVKRIQGDVNSFMAGAITPLIEIISKFINIIIIFILLLFINWQVILVAVVFFSAILFISNLFFRKRIILGNLDRKDMVSARYQSAFQLLTGIKSAIIHNSQEYFLKRFKKQWQIIANHDSFLTLASNGPRYAIEGIVFSGIIILVLFMFSKGNSLENILPIFVLFVMAAYRILPGLQIISASLNRMKSHQYAVDILTEDFKDKIITEENQNTTLEKRPIVFSEKILLKDLCFRYPNVSEDTLRSINLTIKKGQRVGIIGSSGAGKSTLVDAVLGLLKPSRGGIIIDHKPLNETNIASWRKKIGYVPQDIFLIDDTVINNIAFGVPEKDIDLEKVKAAAKLAQIHDFISETMSEGYKTICGDRGIKLSGGQRQRIVLARALYGEPEILIFDEATSALDNETEKRLIASIDALPKNLTIIQIAHRLETLKNTDVIFVFKKGKLKSQGIYSDLILEINNIT
ncbi:ABC transporter ATP-binding protein [Winogradskyella aurantia]|uniref:ABC transporter ATP-binding protein n=1 Tax=Winogradskyella aurantia TaxID=1915063 RepID=A0A265UVA2_9FLAO|nr:ABC transporter ATP-binding protein [Winogradskyella aurantia]OZV69244.1 hypothetical protein CA834_07245 [Winogradskyella aurantia]